MKQKFLKSFHWLIANMAILFCLVINSCNFWENLFEEKQVSKGQLIVSAQNGLSIAKKRFDFTITIRDKNGNTKAYSNLGDDSIKVDSLPPGPIQIITSAAGFYSDTTKMVVEADRKKTDTLNLLPLDSGEWSPGSKYSLDVSSITKISNSILIPGKIDIQISPEALEDVSPDFPIRIRWILLDKDGVIKIDVSKNKLENFKYEFAAVAKNNWLPLYRQDTVAFLQTVLEAKKGLGYFPVFTFEKIKLTLKTGVSFTYANGIFQFNARKYFQLYTLTEPGACDSVEFKFYLADFGLSQSILTKCSDGVKYLNFPLDSRSENLFYQQCLDSIPACKGTYEITASVFANKKLSYIDQLSFPYESKQKPQIYIDSVRNNFRTSTFYFRFISKVGVDTLNVFDWGDQTQTLGIVLPSLKSDTVNFKLSHEYSEIPKNNYTYLIHVTDSDGDFKFQEFPPPRDF